MVRPAGFDCVGSVVWPAAPAASLDAPVRFYAADGVAGFEGALVEVCAAGSDCATALDSGTTGADGRVTLTFPTPDTGFDGYLRVSATDHIPTRMWFFPPIAEASNRWLMEDHVKIVIAPVLLEQLGGPGYTYDPSMGAVVATAIDCRGVFSDAVTVTLDGAAPDNGEAGDSIWLDVTPGNLELVATITETGEEIARISGTVRAGEVSAFHFGPMPATR